MTAKKTVAAKKAAPAKKVAPAKVSTPAKAKTAVETVKPITAMTVVERAQLALGYNKTDKELVKLALGSKDIVSLKSPDAYQQAQVCRLTLVRTRTEIQKLGKTARDDAQAFAKAVIAEENRLIAIISPEEERLKNLQAEWDAIIEAENQRKIAEEMAIREALMARVEALASNLKFGDTAASIKERLDRITAAEVDETFGDMMEIALAKRVNSIQELSVAYESAKSAEAAQAEAAKLREQQALMAAQQRELEEGQRKLREEQERAVREQQAAAAKIEEQRLASEREAAAREQGKIDAENARIKAEHEAAERAEQARKAAELEKAKLPDKQKLNEFAVMIGNLEIPEMMTAPGKKLTGGIAEAISSLQARIIAAAESL